VRFPLLFFRRKVTKRTRHCHLSEKDALLFRFLDWILFVHPKTALDYSINGALAVFFLLLLFFRRKVTKRTRHCHLSEKDALLFRFLDWILFVHPKTTLHPKNYRCFSGFLFAYFFFFQKTRASENNFASIKSMAP